MKLNTSALEGEVHKHIEVKYNHGQALSLMLTGKVQSIVRLDPSVVYFPETSMEQLKSGDPVTQEITLLPLVPDVKILGCKTDPYYVNIHATEDLGGGGKKLILGLNPDAPLGPFKTELIVELQHPKVSKLTIDIHGEITEFGS